MHRLQRLALVLAHRSWLAACGDDDDDRGRSPTATATLVPPSSDAHGWRRRDRHRTVPRSPPPLTAARPSPVTAAPSATTTATGHRRRRSARWRCSAATLSTAPTRSPATASSTIPDMCTSPAHGSASAYRPMPKFDTLRAYLDTTAASANQLQGFSTFAPIRVLFDAPLQHGPAPRRAPY